MKLLSIIPVAMGLIVQTPSRLSLENGICALTVVPLPRENSMVTKMPPTLWAVMPGILLMVPFLFFIGLEALESKVDRFPLDQGAVELASGFEASQSGLASCFRAASQMLAEEGLVVSGGAFPNAQSLHHLFILRIEHVPERHGNRMMDFFREPIHYPLLFRGQLRGGDTE